MVTFPFNKRTIKNQKIFSIIILLAGLFLMFVSAPFYIKFEEYVIISGLIGLILFFIGLFYFLDAFFK